MHASVMGVSAGAEHQARGVRVRASGLTAGRPEWRARVSGVGVRAERQVRGVRVRGSSLRAGRSEWHVGL